MHIARHAMCGISNASPARPVEANALPSSTIPRRSATTAWSNGVVASAVDVLFQGREYASARNSPAFPAHHISGRKKPARNVAGSARSYFGQKALANPSAHLAQTSAHTPLARDARATDLLAQSTSPVDFSALHAPGRTLTSMNAPIAAPPSQAKARLLARSARRVAAVVKRWPRRNRISVGPRICS